MKKSRQRQLDAKARAAEHEANRAAREYQKTLSKYRLEDKRGKRGPIRNKGVNPIPSYASDADERGLPPTSDRVVAGGSKRDLTTDHLWRRDSVETPETIEAIQRKAKSAAPLYPKGGLQLPTPGHDPKTDGRRRT